MHGHSLVGMLADSIKFIFRRGKVGDSMVMTRGSERRWSSLLVPLACCAAGAAVVTCGFSAAPVDSTDNSSGGSTANSSGTSATGSGGSTGNPGAGGDTGPAAGGGMVTGGAGDAVGAGGAAGGGVTTGFKNYELTGTWPALKAAIATAPGKLTYTKISVHTRFLAESCSIADYNNDGKPDISAGRRWYEGPDFKVEHIFRGGHNDLPRNGDSPEIVDGVSDDWADYPFDMDGDGLPDIINIASADADTTIMPDPKPQTHGTGYWYKNPGAATAATNTMWTANLIHSDIRQEQHGLVDVDGDGKPEIFGACKGCTPAETKGYYQADWKNPTAGWVYHPVTQHYVFPFNGTGWLHGLGFGDVNGDGKPDLLERGGAWLQQAGGMWNATACPAAGCGWVKQTLYDGDPADNRGGSHMYAVDVDGDGDQDIISADWAHGWGLAWYEQTPGMKFVKHQILGSNSPADIAKYGPVYFSEPHALQVVDMDGDGVPDIVTGKERFAHPISYGDPDPNGVPYVYVFKTIRNKPSVAGSVTFEPHMVDNVVGVGRQLAVGHANTDGIMDICVATKLGLYVFLGQ